MPCLPGRLSGTFMFQLTGSGIPPGAGTYIPPIGIHGNQVTGIITMAITIIFSIATTDITGGYSNTDIRDGANIIMRQASVQPQSLS